MRNSIYILLIVFLYGCPPCDTVPVTIDNGSLPVSALKFVPYQSGETYRFKHSNGLVIKFKTFRETREEREERCTECCSYVQYEVNSTWLTSDYPIFDFYFSISNRDTSYYNCYASIGKYGFNIPTADFHPDYFSRVDSMMIDSFYYRDVFKLKSHYGSYNNSDSIYADSLFYNYEHGILKIIMSNGESYEAVK